MKQIIDGHNKRILNSTKAPDKVLKTCNCRNKLDCPLQGKCLTSSVIYQATVNRLDNHQKETYIGLTEHPFKTRYYSHIHSFKKDSQRDATTLSQHIWSLKDNNKPYSIQWKIITRAKPYSTKSKKCNLCLTEKYYIICKTHMSSLNNRNELVSSCRHKRKHLLCNID